MSTVSSSSTTESVLNYDAILAWCKNNWMVPNSRGDPKRSPNAYIIYRSWAGNEAAKGWKYLSSDQKRFWEETAEALNMEHKRKFANYVFRPRPPQKKQLASSQRKVRSSISRSQQSQQRNAYKSGGGSPVSVPLYLAPFQDEDYASPEQDVSGGPPNVPRSETCPVNESLSPCSQRNPESNPESSTSGSPWALYNSIKSSYEKGWETLNRLGKPKGPPNAFMVFKQIHNYNSIEASRIWKDTTEDDKCWWDQVAAYIKQDHRVKFPNYRQERIPTWRTTGRTQDHPEQEPSTSTRTPIRAFSPVQQRSSPPFEVLRYRLDNPHPGANNAENRGNGQEPQQSSSRWWDDMPRYEAATTFPTGTQWQPFPDEHIESSASLNLYPGSLQSSSGPTTTPSDALPMDLVLGLLAGVYTSEPIDAMLTLEWLHAILGLPSPDGSSDSS
jgi:hypothetical protein